MTDLELMRIQLQATQRHLKKAQDEIASLKGSGPTASGFSEMEMLHLDVVEASKRYMDAMENLDMAKADMALADDEHKAAELAWYRAAFNLRQAEQGKVRY